ncbi:DUF4476 domain-containing protein [Ekhidna sp.]|uniref:DUF4476 domain-containing protein n=1 Tax=Ekhidna sp. TaxID=2608089 RepID=UPI003CCC1C0F
MKKLLILLLLASIAHSTLAQECYPVSNATTKRIYKKLKKASSDEEKLMVADNLILSNCFTSYQIGVLTTLFSADDYKRKFVKRHFHAIADPEHIFEVFEAFDDMAITLTTYEELRPYILKKKTVDVSLHESDLNAMSMEEFEDKFRYVKAENFSSDKKERVMYFFKDEALTIYQIRRIATQFRFSNDRFWILEQLYENCTEKDKYYQFAELFRFSNDRDKLLAFIDES